jgi:hypothetical protein
VLEPFYCEKSAYENLLHFGICEERIVPRCYGFYDFPNWDSGPRTDVDPLWMFREDEYPPKAILLEYFDIAVPLSTDNITEDKAKAIIYATRRIHDAYIVHNDLDIRNILSLPDGRVVLVSAYACSVEHALIYFRSTSTHHLCILELW